VGAGFIEATIVLTISGFDKLSHRSTKEASVFSRLPLLKLNLL